MRRQAFRLRQSLGVRRQAGESFCVAADQGGALQEIIKRQPGLEARRPTRRQHVVGSGHIVSEGLGGVPAKEDGPGMAYPVGEGLRILHREFDVLRRNEIDEGG